MEDSGHDALNSNGYFYVRLYLDCFVFQASIVVYGNFYVRLYWNACGFQANIVDTDVLMLLFVGLRRSWDAVFPSFSSGHDALIVDGLTRRTVWRWHYGRTLVDLAMAVHAFFWYDTVRAVLPSSVGRLAASCVVLGLPFVLAEKSAMRTVASYCSFHLNEVLLASSCTSVQQLVDCVRSFPVAKGCS